MPCIDILGSGIAVRVFLSYRQVNRQLYEWLAIVDRQELLQGTFFSSNTVCFVGVAVCAFGVAVLSAAVMYLGGTIRHYKDNNGYGFQDTFFT